MYDPGEQLSRAVNDLRAWVETRLRRAGSAFGGALAERVAQAAERLARSTGTHETGRGRALVGRVAERLVLVASGQLDDELTLRLVHLAGGRSAKVRILAGLELDFAPPARRQARQFARFGVEDVLVATVASRVQAEDEVRAAMLREADLVVVAADDPRDAALLLGESAVGRALHEVWAAGGAVALLGAAAWLAGEWVLAPGGSGGGTAQPALPGLGLLPGCATAAAGPAWGTRGLWPFLDAVLAGPATIERALWLEPGAAAFFGGGAVEVWGHGALAALDAVDLRAALGGAAGRGEGAYAAFPRRRPRTLTSLGLAFAPPGYRLNLASLVAEPVEGGAGAAHRAGDVRER